MSKIKPCPLCGGKAVLIKINKTRIVVACTKCFLIKPYDGEGFRLKKECVIDWWNRRSYEI